MSSFSLKFAKTLLTKPGRIWCRPWYSTQSNNIDVNVDNEGIAIVTMKRAPANTLNLEMLEDLNKTIKDLEGNKSCKGAILTSGIPNIFSGGLEIMEMYQPKTDRFKQFWTSLQQTWMDLYVSKLVTIAAITGHAPAGGCLLTLSCDYRIMVNSKYLIGLNETALGIVAPLWFQQLFQRTVGHRESEYGLSLGKLYGCDEALQKGLIDKLANSNEEAIQDAKVEMKKWFKIPTLARQATKRQLREDAVNQLMKVRQQETDMVCKFLMQDTTQKALGLYLEGLKRKR